MVGGGKNENENGEGEGDEGYADSEHKDIVGEGILAASVHYMVHVEIEEEEGASRRSEGRGSSSAGPHWQVTYFDRFCLAGEGGSIFLGLFCFGGSILVLIIGNTMYISS